MYKTEKYSLKQSNEEYLRRKIGPWTQWQHNIEIDALEMLRVISDSEGYTESWTQKLKEV